MRSYKWIVFAAALGMMAVTGRWLKEAQGLQRLGPAGVKVGPVPIYDEKSRLAATQSVVLPAAVLGIPSRPLPITTMELDDLPKDTTFGRRFYRQPGSDFGVQVGVVLMGTDHTSIHQPQYCLYAQDWNITDTERIRLRMKQPFAYDIPAIKLTASRQIPDSRQVVKCLYVYWFVSADKITAEEGSRLLSMWKSAMLKGKMDRWAYISYFVTCLPGTEQATFERLEKFIQASAPEFQLVTGQPSNRLPVMADEK